MSGVDWSRRLAEAARLLQAESGSRDTLELAVNLAVELINGADDAAISLAERGTIVDTPAATSPRAFAADKLQHEEGSGPLLLDVWEHEVVSGDDLADETRWGAWGKRVAKDLGIGSMVCFRMFADGERLGALTLYASRAHAFQIAAVDEGISFAAHAAVALEAALAADNMALALDSRTVIGQATGIAMERYGIDAVRAFGLLKRISQDNNRKLHEVATELIRTRAIPR